MAREMMIQMVKMEWISNPTINNIQQSDLPGEWLMIDSFYSLNCA